MFDITLGIKSIIKTFSVRLHIENSFRTKNVVAMATTDRDFEPN